MSSGVYEEGLEAARAVPPGTCPTPHPAPAPLPHPLATPHPHTPTPPRPHTPTPPHPNVVAPAGMLPRLHLRAPCFWPRATERWAWTGRAPAACHVAPGARSASHLAPRVHGRCQVVCRPPRAAVQASAHGTSAAAQLDLSRSQEEAPRQRKKQAALRLPPLPACLPACRLSEASPLKAPAR